MTQDKDRAAPAAFAHWYVAQLKSSGLEMARRNLEQNGFVTFMPLLHGKRNSPGQVGKPKPAPMFLGYVFVQLPYNRKDWRTIDGIPGVSRILLTDANNPAPLPVGFVEALKDRCDKNDLFRTIDDLISDGAEEFASGAFSEIIGEIEGLSQSGRAPVLLEILRQGTFSDSVPSSEQHGKS